MSTLIIKNDGIGDLILSSGIIGELAEKLGSVDLVTCGQNKEIAEMIPGLRRRVYVSRDGIRLRYKPLKLGIAWPVVPTEDKAVIREIRQEHYERVIVLRRYIRYSSLWIAKQIAAKQTLGCWLFPANLPKRLAVALSDGWQVYAGALSGSEVHYYCEALRNLLGLQLRGDPFLSIPEDKGGGSAAVSSCIGVCISGSQARWPKEHWARLVSALGLLCEKVVIFGGHEYTGAAEFIRANVRNVVDYTGKLTFSEAVPHIRKCQLLISNDTGFAHFASLLPVKTLIILGGGTHDRFFPWPRSKNQFVIRHSLPCYDCDWRCIKSSLECCEKLLPEKVLAFAKDILLGAPISREVDTNPERPQIDVGWRYATAGTCTGNATPIGMRL
jgi:ADP-heptose:LPS heptosyltransferase